MARAPSQSVPHRDASYFFARGLGFRTIPKSISNFGLAGKPMSQPPLFVESVYDALRAIVNHLGGPKTVGILLWPAKSVDDARRQLLDSMNPDRAEKLDPEQIVMLFRMAREADFHVSKHWFDSETGYLPSTPADPTEEQARLVSVIESAGLTLQRALAMLDKMRERKTLSKVA
jgi:hypothetical protein